MGLEFYLRECTTCGSLSADDEKVCGVCGGSLAKVDSHSLNKSPGLRDHPFRPRHRISRAGIFGIVIGLILMGSGAIVFIPARGTTLLLVPILFGLGFILLKSGIDTITGRPFRPSYRWGWYIRPSGRGSDYLDREADMEEKKEEDLKAGVKD